MTLRFRRTEAGSTPLWRRYVRFLRPDVDSDIDDELRFHLDMCAEDLERRGHSREEAERVARQRFGEVGSVRDWLARHDRKRQRNEERIDLMDALVQDLRFSVRALRRSPGFVAAAVLCLGLGLGANATVYSILDGMLLRPLPFADVDRLVSVGRSSRTTGGMNAVALPYLLELRARSRTVTPLAAYAAGAMSIDGSQGSEPVEGARVSAEFFSILGARPLLGRGFVPEESAPGAPRVVVLSDALWRERYGSDSGIVGRAIALDGQPTTVVGVMPARIGITGDRERLWVPLEHRMIEAERGSNYLFTVGRLAPGVTLDAARSEFDAIGRELERAHPGADAGTVPRVIPFRDSLVPREITVAFGAMFGAVGFVLLIACANVASLLLARASGRTRELAVRAALGATRGRIVRLVVLEGVLIAMAGGVLGLFLAKAGIAAVLGSIPVVYPAWVSIEVDARVVVYALILALAAGTLLGLVPALRATRPAVAPILRDGGRGAAGGHAGGRRLRSGLVTTQLALTVVLLAGAGLMMKSVLKLQATDPGFDPRGVLAVKVFAPGARYELPTARQLLLERARERLAALPGVTAVTTAGITPLSGDWSSGNYVSEGQQAEPGREPWAHQRRVADGYFALLRYPLVAGREFSSAEAADPGAAVVVVNETLARRAWPGASALGRRLSFGRGAETHWLTVVGVAHDAQIVGLERGPESVIYVPQATAVGRRPTLLLRTAGEPGALVPAVRAALREIDPTLAIVDAEAMPAMVRESLWRQWLFGRMFSAFAVAALLLALVGVYGVVTYTVAARTHELGVRLALGAQTMDVYRTVLGGSARLAAVGLGAGAALALALTRVLSSALPNVSPRDPAVLLCVVVLLAAATLVASWIPARRATRLEPVASLRAD